MTAYYNEIDPFAAAWLRELIKAGHIAPGDVDERSIEDVTPDDLRSYAQAHFFAGIGVWSHALRRAGWPDDRPVWTGSCPCQPFSAAGQGGGFADERHLWPTFHHLIRERRPPVVLGEQAASKDGLAWLDLVSTDMEATGYAGGAVDLCAAGVGAPHIRQRQWFAWLADAAGGRHQPREGDARVCDADLGAGAAAVERGAVRTLGGMADTAEFGRFGRRSSQAGAKPGAVERPDGLRSTGGMADAELPPQPRQRSVGGEALREQAANGSAGSLMAGRLDENAGNSGMLREEAPVGAGNRPCPADSFWRDADWLFCRDGKWRPVEPGTFPLAHGAPARVGRLRGYGNAINAEAARFFIEAVLETEADAVRLNPSRMTTDRSLFE